MMKTFSPWLALAALAAPCAAEPFGAPASAPVVTVPAGKNAAAMRATKDGRWPDALALWNAASQRSPDDPDVSAELGWAELENGRAGDARRDFTRALRLAPVHLRAQAGLTLLAINDHQNDDAIRLAIENARAHPESGYAFRILGDAQMAAARRSDAETAYQKAVRLDPSDAQSQAALGETLLVRRKNGEALRAYRSAARLDAPNGAIQEGLGRAAMAGGHYGEAAAAFAAAMDAARTPKADWDRLDTLGMLALDALGRAAAGLSDASEARQDVYVANTRILALSDALADAPGVKDADMAGDSAMAQRALAYSLIGQAAALDLSALKTGGNGSPDAVVFREQARRALVAAKSAANAKVAR